MFFYFLIDVKMNNYCGINDNEGTFTSTIFFPSHLRRMNILCIKLRLLNTIFCTFEPFENTY